MFDEFIDEQNKKPELLAPAGNWESLRVAVYNGADAVYIGLSDFNARAKAQNFASPHLLSKSFLDIPPQA